MQLASTLFGIVVLQVKPQLEKVLKLPADSLSKEIKLTQDLLELFMKYQVRLQLKQRLTSQISSDLISYEGDANASKADKITQVKRHVKAMHDMLEGSKEKAIEEQVLVSLEDNNQADFWLDQTNG